MAIKKIRNMKVYEQSGYNYRHTPVITLKGQWLKAAGFDDGDPVQVKCEEGWLVIVPDKERATMSEEEQAYIEEETKKFHTRLVAERKARYGVFEKAFWKRWQMSGWQGLVLWWISSWERRFLWVKFTYVVHRKEALEKPLQR